MGTTRAAEFVESLTRRVARRRGIDARRCRLPTFCTLLCVTGTVGATPRQSLDEVEQVAEAFVEESVGGAGATASPLDRRLTLAACTTPLEPFLRPGARVRSRTVVGVRCTGEAPWKIYVPVTLSVEADVLVLDRALPRGHRLEAADFRLERRDVSRLVGGYASEAAAVVGQKLKRSLPAGAILEPALLEARRLVQRGQTVTLAASRPGIDIRVEGEALADGRLNERIRVRNASSGRIVEGLVRSPEVVEILVR